MRSVTVIFLHYTHFLFCVYRFHSFSSFRGKYGNFTSLNHGFGKPAKLSPFGVT